MPGQDHEATCLCCGRCCYKKVVFDGRPYLTNIPCKHLDVRTNRCTIYAKRYKVKDGCIPFQTAIEIGSFPSDCPYVVGIEGYTGPGTYEQLLAIMRLHGLK